MSFGKIFQALILGVLCLSAGAEEKLQPDFVKGSESSIGMALGKQVLYTSGWKKRLTWYDVSDPLKPKKIGSFRGVYGRQMVIAGDLLYVTARQQGLWIFNIKDPRKPMLIKRFDTVELATGLAVSGDLAVTSERIYGSPVYSVADPEHPKLVTILRGGEIQSCVFRYPILYGGSWYDGRIKVWDLSDPLNPRMRSSVPMHGYGDGVTIDGDYLYAATGIHRLLCPKGTGKNDGWGLEIFDIKTDPVNPKRTGMIHFPPKPVGSIDSWTVRVSQDIAYVGASGNGMFIVDVRDKTAPKLLGHFELNPGSGRPKDCVGSVVLGRGVIYIGTMKGLWVLPYPKAVPVKVQTASEPKIKSIPPLKIPNYTVYPVDYQARRLALDNNTLYAALGNGGLGIYSVSDEGLKLVKTFPKNCVYDVSFRDGKLYLAEGIDGMGVYELKNGQLNEHGRMKASCYNLHLLSDPRWMAYSSGGIIAYFADIRDLKNIRTVFSQKNRYIIYIDSLGNSDIGGLYPVNGHAGGFYWIDLSGEKPKLLQHYKQCFTSQLSGVCTFGDRFFIPCGKTFRIFKPGEDITTVKAYKGKGEAFDGIPASDGKIVAISWRNHGTLSVYDLSDPEKPVLLKDRSFMQQMCNPDRAVFWKGRLIVPGGFGGILFENAK